MRREGSLELRDCWICWLLSSIVTLDYVSDQLFTRGTYMHATISMAASSDQLLQQQPHLPRVRGRPGRSRAVPVTVRAVHVMCHVILRN